MQWAVALSGSILPLRSERINKRAERAIWLEVVTINAISTTQRFKLGRSILFSCTFLCLDIKRRIFQKKPSFLYTLVHAVMVTFLVSMWGQRSVAEWCSITCQLSNSLLAQYHAWYQYYCVVWQKATWLIRITHLWANSLSQDTRHSNLKAAPDSCRFYYSARRIFNPVLLFADEPAGH